MYIATAGKQWISAFEFLTSNWDVQFHVSFIQRRCPYPASLEPSPQVHQLLWLLARSSSPAPAQRANLPGTWEQIDKTKGSDDKNDHIYSTHQTTLGNLSSWSSWRDDVASTTLRSSWKSFHTSHLPGRVLILQITLTTTHLGGMVAMQIKHSPSFVTSLHTAALAHHRAWWSEESLLIILILLPLMFDLVVLIISS